MELNANINVISQEYNSSYKYYVDYMDETKFDEAFELRYKYFGEYVGKIIHQDFNELEQLDNNTWKAIDPQDYIPFDKYYTESTVKLKKIRVQFPVYSPESDSEQQENFVLEIFTYINGVKVILSTQLINQKDALTHKCIKRLANEYYEYKDIWIVDPFLFCYGDEWKDFRQTILCEPDKLNNTGSLLTFSLTPVTLDVNGNWARSINNIGGINSVMLDDNPDDKMKLEISFINNYKYKPCIDVNTQYNQVYDTFSEYLLETYGLDCNETKLYAQFEIVVKDKENIWKQVKTDMEVITNDWKPVRKFSREDINFVGWEEFTPGLEFKVTLNIYFNKNDIPKNASLENWVPEEREDEYVLSLYLISEGLFITPEVFKFFIIDEDWNEKINYKNIDDMNVFNISAVNRIEKKIINVERSDNYKSNIIRPVFFRSQQSGSIQIHTDVSENVAINLDAYKSKVDAFRLRIEGIDFVEVGRNNSGVIFKIIPSKLPQEETEGEYYIIDGNNELVTSGNYYYI